MRPILACSLDMACILVVSMFPVKPGHDADQQCAKHENNDVDRPVEFDHQGVQSQHQEDTDVLVEVLYRNGAARTHQQVAAVLKQGVHRHHEEAGHDADTDQQQDGDQGAGDEHHGQYQHTHADTYWNDFHRMFQLDEACRKDSADGDTDRDPGRELGCCADVVMQYDSGPSQHQQAQRRPRTG